MISADELRKKYLDFFVSKGHIQIPSASLIPENDPSVLFTTAGMHPLVPYLLGEPHPAGKRLVNVQKCVRTGDIDEVGDATHLTFFEMLGNWSLGDYFKDDSIAWSFEFLTSADWLAIPVNKLAVSVFAGDDDAPFDEESMKKWMELGILESRIAKLGKDDNWWPAGGKHPGPQGPDTEIFYWTGTEVAPESFDPKNKFWVEIWNNVFMQFLKGKDGSPKSLDQKNVDTGMGLERTLAVLNDVATVFETDLFISIISAIESATGAKYGSDAAVTRSMRIIADHVRSAVMMIADGVAPSNKDQGYILRRLIRRAICESTKLVKEGIDLTKIAHPVIAMFEGVYPIPTAGNVIKAIKDEQEKFSKTLHKGLGQFEKFFKQGAIGGKEAFDLYATYGFPLELTEDLVKERGATIDREAFEHEFAHHQELSSQGSEKKFKGGLADASEETTRLHTATHLLHQALRMVLGDGVAQKGSNITTERLRFDFSHGEKMTPEQITEVERIVNEQIEKAMPVICETMSVEEAEKSGAIGLFKEKYKTVGDQVKVYNVGNSSTSSEPPFSREICGGPHASNTKELGHFKILKEEASSAGIRRIKAILE
ncbi:MAG: alanine--tRNA ligase [Patescibacteria group bacterium]|jgi:alanyl-tRNA synthetase